MSWHVLIILNKIDTDNLIKGLKYSALISLVLFVLFLPVYFFLLKSEGLYPFSVLSLFIGGILLIGSGCIGPGRYFKEYPIFIFTPKTSDSFFEQIPISAVSIEDINEANIIINNKLAGVISFENKMGQAIIMRDDINDYTINKLWIEINGNRSNPVSFTFFDFNEDMDLDEVDEFSNYDKQMKIETLELFKEKYNAKLNQNFGSIGLGFLFSGVIVMLLGTLFEKYII